MWRCFAKLYLQFNTVKTKKRIYSYVSDSIVSVLGSNIVGSLKPLYFMCVWGLVLTGTPKRGAEQVQRTVLNIFYIPCNGL